MKGMNIVAISFNSFEPVTTKTTWSVSNHEYNNIGVGEFGIEIDNLYVTSAKDH